MRDYNTSYVLQETFAQSAYPPHSLFGVIFLSAERVS